MNGASWVIPAIVLLQWTILTSVIVGFAWVVTLAFRKSASVRHLIWLASLFATLFVPLATRWIPSQFVIHASSPAKPVPPPVHSRPLSPSKVAARTAKNSDLPASIAHKNETDDVASGTGAIPFPTYVCLFGLAVLAIQAGSAAVGVTRLRKRSVCWDGGEIDPPSLALQLGVRRTWQLRQSSASRPPAAMTWGFFRPIVLLPRDCGSWTFSRLRATVLHELAHVSRGDSLSQWVAVGACALHWYNPAVWLAAKALRGEAEAAADDAVISSGVKPSDYAAELLSIAAELGRLRPPVFSQGVSIMKDSRIEARIRAIVDPSRRRRGVTSIQTLAATVVGIGAVALLAAFCPTVAFGSPALEPPLGGVAYQQSSSDAKDVDLKKQIDKIARESENFDEVDRTVQEVVAKDRVRQEKSSTSQAIVRLRAQIAVLQKELAESTAQLRTLEQRLKQDSGKAAKRKQLLMEVDAAQQNAEVTKAKMFAEYAQLQNQKIARDRLMEIDATRSEARKVADLEERARDQKSSDEAREQTLEKMQRDTELQSADLARVNEKLIQERIAARRQNGTDPTSADRGVVKKLAEMVAQEKELADRQNVIEALQRQVQDAIERVRDTQAKAEASQQLARKALVDAAQATAQARMAEAQAKKAKLAAELAQKRTAEKARLDAEKAKRTSDPAKKKPPVKR